MADLKRPAPSDGPAFDDPADLANAVISTLQVPEEPTHVAQTYANDKNSAHEVQAYAKIAGQNWTYYVKSLSVTLGRNTDAAATPQASGHVHIDLGPAKVVSRQHAHIAYNIDLRCWELVVLGRNGARVDGAKTPVGPGTATPLHSGAILDVGGTQMMFILPDTPPAIAPKMAQSCLARYVPGGKRTRVSSMSSFQMFERGSLAHSPSSVSAVSLQNNLDQDLSREDAKDIKPPYSYATMITQAILSNPDGVMSLAEIYNWISSRYAYYKYSKTGWQNSIRHNLSLNKAFEKVPRRPNEPGKGMKWQISDAYRADFLKKVQTGTLSKSRRGSSVSRTLQIHLATHQGLPETKSYGDAGTESSEQAGHVTANTPTVPTMGQPYPVQTMGYVGQNGYGVYGNYPRPMYPAQMVPQQHQQQSMNIQSTPNMGGQNPQNMNTHIQNTQNMNTHAQHAQHSQHIQPPEKRMELASPMRHPDTLKQKQHSYAHQNGANAYIPGANLVKPSQPKIEISAADNGRASFSNSSHVPNTSESLIQSSTAPTTSNTSELGLSFTSPKKIVPLEAFTPERGSKSANIGKSANVHQSSPAFWNFVQFSTPNGQTPGRKNSEESNGPESPTLNRGMEKKGNVYDDSPPK